MTELLILIAEACEGEVTRDRWLSLQIPMTLIVQPHEYIPCHIRKAKASEVLEV